VAFRRLRRIGLILAIVGAVFLAGWGGYSYTQTKYYVGQTNGQISIYKGIREELLGFKFSAVYQQVPLYVYELPEYQQKLVGNTIYATDLEDALRIVDRLKASVVVE
jgi:protein phosphatase